MNIAILSRNASLYSTHSLFVAARKRHHNVRILDHLQCDIVIEKGKPAIFYQDEEVTNIHAIIPRIGTSATSYGSAVIRQFKAMGAFSTLDATPLLNTRDKLSCLQLLAGGGIDVPKSVVSNFFHYAEDLVDEVGPLPVVIKMIQGTHGQGVILGEKMKTVIPTLEALQKARQRIMLQEFIEEAKGADIRIFIVNNEIVGVMKRQAALGEFRSNLHRGGTSSVISVTGEEADIALRAVSILGLKVAGVDMLRSKRGPLVLEVNASPGLEGIETTTRKDIAGKIIQFVENSVK